MATPRDYQIGAAAAAAFVKAKVPPQYSWVMNSHADEAAQFEAGIAKAVTDAVDADRAKVEAAKGQS